MAENRGKKFEQVIRNCFEDVEGVSVDRLPDQTMGYLGGSNICDYIVYKEPYEYYIECKSKHGNTLSIHSITHDLKHPHDYGDLTNKQWEGMLEKSLIQGVRAGVIVWFIDRDVTMYIPMQDLKLHRDSGNKSVRYDTRTPNCVVLQGKKKRVFFKYAMEKFFEEAENGKEAGRTNK